jgi:hypothetical protein
MGYVRQWQIPIDTALGPDMICAGMKASASGQTSPLQVRPISSARTPAPERAPALNFHHRGNQNQPKPTDAKFLNPVGFGWFKSVLVGLSYQVPENPGKTASFCTASKLFSQPKPTTSKIAEHTGGDAQNFSAENFSENHLRNTKV